MTLQTSIPKAGPIFKRFSPMLEKLGLFTLEDLLYFIPSRYDDFSHISKIDELQPGDVVTIQGEVQEIKNEYTRNRKIIQKAVIADETGTIELIWFNQPYIAKSIKQNDTLSVSGKVDTFGRKKIFQGPEFEVMHEGIDTLHTGRLVPIYHETRGLSSKWLRRQIYKLLQDFKDEIVEYLPEQILDKTGGLPIYTALKQIHFPDSLDETDKARERLAFDELFLLQLRALQRKTAWKETLVGPVFDQAAHAHEITELKTALPFSLTSAQENAIHDIFADMSSPRPMNRLLQGDVGSGKTIVAAVSMYLAYLNGYQSVLMAPTEILAQQHFASIVQLLEPFGVKIELRTGSHKTKPTVESPAGDFHMLIGTHAVLSEKVQFSHLGLVVIDEQQRFGVQQRGIIRSKGKNPHLLTMTATPIPRTVALTLYGDLDISYLNEMPRGRKTIKTWLVPPEKRDGAYGWIRTQIQETTSQIFIICPFIEESESMQTVKAAAVEFERLKKHVFPDLKLGLLHGKLKAKEKDAVLQEFRDKKFAILVATPVVEVGIDIPNATVIMIEASERFGLAGLHQLRGRVGRGDKQSYCLLFTEAKSPLTLERLRAMEKSNIGAELAELDLRLRGPGDIYGTMQSGRSQLKIASFSDFPLIEKAKREADQIFPKLTSYPPLLEKLKEITVEKVTPD